MPLEQDPIQAEPGLEMIGRVVRAQSGFHQVLTPEGEFTAVLRGRFKKKRRQTGLVALGDMVRIELLELPEGESGQVDSVIVELLPRDSAITRRAPGPKGQWSRDVVVANIDLLLPVFAAAEPEPHLRMLDRFLAVAEIDEIDVLIVLNKVELGVPEEIEAGLVDLERAGYRVLRCSARQGLGMDALRESLAGRISALVGPSGVGKSSLLNAVEPGLGLRVGAVSEALGKGKHTTRVGQLHALAGGGMVADTPGLRELGVWDINPGELEWAFREFRPHIGSCRFGDCSHLKEPGCAVRQAVETGDISPRRFDSYRRLLQDEA